VSAGVARCIFVGVVRAGADCHVSGSAFRIRSGALTPRSGLTVVLAHAGASAGRVARFTPDVAGVARPLSDARSPFTRTVAGLHSAHST